MLPKLSPFVLAICLRLHLNNNDVMRAKFVNDAALAVTGGLDVFGLTIYKNRQLSS